MRRIAKVSFSLAVFGVVWILLASFLVNHYTRDKVYSDAALIPSRKVGLVLGCSKTLGNGQRNLFFANRIQAAVELFRAGKVEYLIVSGDNHSKTYDEPQDMKESLIEAGVPAERIFCDYAGFRTLDSIVRVREIFSQSQVTVISQRFHNERAIYIAQHQGIDAIGFNAPDVDAYNSFKTKSRELVARANMLMEIFVTHRSPRYLGQKVSLPA